MKLVFKISFELNLGVLSACFFMAETREEGNILKVPWLFLRDAIAELAVRPEDGELSLATVCLGIEGSRMLFFPVLMVNLGGAKTSSEGRKRVLESAFGELIR